MHSKKLAIVAMATLAAMAVPAVAYASPDPSVTVTVMGTSDLHGNTLNWDYFKNSEFTDGKGNVVGLARVSTLVNKIRAERGAAGPCCSTPATPSRALRWPTTTPRWSRSTRRARSTRWPAR